MAKENLKEKINREAAELDQLVKDKIGAKPPIRLAKLVEAVMGTAKGRKLFESAKSRYQNRGADGGLTDTDLVRRSLTRLLRSGQVQSDRSEGWSPV